MGMEPASWAMILAAAAAAVSAASAYSSGKAQAQAAAFEEAQYEDAGRAAQAEGMANEVRLRREFAQAKDAARAKASMFGYFMGESPSFGAFEAENERLFQGDLADNRIATMSSVRKFGLGAQQKGIEGQAARRAGMFGVVTSLLGGASRVGMYSSMASAPAGGIGNGGTAFGGYPGDANGKFQFDP
jgi:hypothetical protein